MSPPIQLTGVPENQFAVAMGHRMHPQPTNFLDFEYDTEGSANMPPLLHINYSQLNFWGRFHFNFGLTLYASYNLGLFTFRVAYALSTLMAKALFVGCESLIKAIRNGFSNQDPPRSDLSNDDSLNDHFQMEQNFNQVRPEPPFNPAPRQAAPRRPQNPRLQQNH
uniref:Uncharacterized protein n=1 Tax=Strombidium rassoulzadegani TaxID=1082188 RepID=A0A7S3FZM0_9SPIT|mmetsp:Transcript_9697/g.16320  ORF Transcript_9697/g.16320 Transcript_9697/m.16320 type:complete len:165 (+) Transcript_9697:1379-1873(+)